MANTGNGDLNFVSKLWQSADKMRNNMDAAEYKHVVLGLIFLKYISDAFDEVYTALENDKKNHADPEDIDEYRSRNIFWVPPEARWSYLQKSAKQPTIGKLIDTAMEAVERDNPILKGVLPQNYARPALDKQRLGELIDLIGTIGLGDKENRSRDILGRVYEYFLGEFADAEGKKAVSSIPLVALFVFWSKCLSPIKAACLILVAGPAECLCRVKNSQRHTADALVIYRCTARNQTKQRGACAR